MSVTVRTYILYGTKVVTTIYDNNRFENEDDYLDYLYEVINKDDSPFKLIYNESDNSYYFGYVLDQASNGNWDMEYLSTRTFSELTDFITPEIEESVQQLLLAHFNTYRDEYKIEHRILTVYC